MEGRRMAMTVKDVREWLDSRKNTDLIAINDEGMALFLASNPDGEYIEVGGVPVEWTCDHCGRTYDVNDLPNECECGNRKGLPHA
jgi:hypothetical protein